MKGASRMAQWEVLCNGGPNGDTVGGTADSIEKACGFLAKMMKALPCTMGQIQRADDPEKKGHFVEPTDGGDD